MNARPAAALLLWIPAVFLSVTISQNFSQTSEDPLSNFLGSAKEAFGDTLFLKADAYFHGGVIEKKHHDETAESIEKEGTITDAKETAGEAPQDWIAGVNREVQVHEIRHLTKEKRKEMLPFFAIATALDPRNVDAVLTTAYWLENEFGKTADAADVLKKGLSDNPDSWEIENALGRLSFRQKNRVFAAAHLREAVRKSVSVKMEPYERVDLQYHLAEAVLAAGDKEEALAAYREASRFFDGKTTPFLRSTILEKIKELSGTQ